MILWKGKLTMKINKSCLPYIKHFGIVSMYLSLHTLSHLNMYIVSFSFQIKGNVKEDEFQKYSENITISILIRVFSDCFTSQKMQILYNPFQD